MFAARHSIRYHRGKQRFNAAQQRDSDGGLYGAFHCAPAQPAGQAATGNEDGMLQYLPPTVSTGKWKYCTASVASNIATSGPGCAV